jgi:hypothetical protein
MEWLDIDGYAEYKISPSGQILSPYGRLLKLTPRPSGYVRVSLHSDGVGKSLAVHRLVAQHFLPNPDDLPVVNHINGNRSDNRVANLEWVTVAQNNARKVRAAKRGPKRGVVQETLDGVVVRTWPAIVDAARALGASRTTIGRCCSGKIKSAGGFRWKYSEEEIPGEEWLTATIGGRSYEVSSKGRVRTLQGVPVHGGKSGRYRSFDNQLVHRLVARAFHPMVDGKSLVNHIDGDTTNNCAENLEWATHTENNQHARDMGLRKPGNEGASTVVIQILADGQKIRHASMKAAAESTGVCRVSISDACRGVRPMAGGSTWTYLYDTPPNAFMTDGDFDSLMEELEI